MSAKLIVDLAKADLQAALHIQCSYKHHPGNQGFDALLEMTRFALICRRCESAPCVKACPRGALEKVPSDTHDAGVLKRANMLCTGCGTCAIACPFGTIYTDLIPFPSSVCDVCRDRLAPGEKPLCVQTCADGCLDYAEVQPGEDLIEVFRGIVARVAGGSTWEPFLKNEEEAKR
ncbi:MAG: 4Fe-4S dicluster domain-containing protein [Phycisphaerales bacterium]|nr:MAG: 4Fe-4S dicluster domain-containing protein [Phycisphaerales bacterium]